LTKIGKFRRKRTLPYLFISKSRTGKLILVNGAFPGLLPMK